MAVSSKDIEHIVPKKMHQKITRNVPVGIRIVLLLTIASITNDSYPQGFTEPSQGKAAVYFVRWSSAGAVYSYEYFHHDQFIGEFKGKGYIRYESEPGEQLFWAASSNKQFITAHLEAGKSYIIDVETGMYGAILFRPISSKNKSAFKKCKKTILTSEPITFTMAELNDGQKKYHDLIVNELNYFREKSAEEEPKVKTQFNFSHFKMSADMFIPKSEMN